MPVEAKILPVMIASPGDVAEERQTVRGVLNDWNSLNSIHEKIVLLPMSWEKNATADLSERAQSQINDRILKRCDLLIGVFWTRLGTPTGEHESGTVEEIKEHVSAGKSAMVYFSRKPVELDSVDHEQYDKLNEFKLWCQSQGITIDYDSIEGFSSLLRDNLTIILRENSYLRTAVSKKTGIQTHNPVELKTVSMDEMSLDMLARAVQSKRGTIIVRNFIGGKLIQAGNDEMDYGGSHKELARLEAAIEELERFELVRAVNFKREIFEVTHEGYEAAERNSLVKP